MRLRHLVFAPLALAACGGAPLPPPPPPETAKVDLPPREAPKPPGLRLPKVAAPTRYDVELTLDPLRPTFDGRITIELDVAEPMTALWLNGSALTVTSAELETDAGQRFPARTVKGGEEYVGFAFDDTVAPGHARLRVAYAGVVSGKDDHGIFAEDEEGARYLFTQFESTHARRAFPCFDEPSYKVPWKLSLKVPAATTALANTPALEERAEAGGTKTVSFAETKPLPAYLVAFAVGTFDLVDAGRTGKNGTPVRIAVPKGQASQAALAKVVTPAALARLEDLLGIPYPYEKLDVVAVPRLVTFGAMENAGLITFTRFSLLAKPEEQTHAFELRLTGTMVHELGHHWFGDLVTTAWWDDIWLNEAFATWVQAKVISPWKPAWNYDLIRPRSTAGAMQTDALASVRRVREPITSDDDIVNAFDDITYQKGAAVIGMFEAYLGNATFLRGLRRYLTERAHKTATTNDLLTALSVEAGQDVRAAFSSFLDQPGVPRVDVKLACDAKTPSVALSQSRYRPLGAGEQAPTTWTVPVCVRYAAGGADARACTLLGKAPSTMGAPPPNPGSGLSTLALPDAKGCPAWVEPNADGAGYYVATYGLPQVDALLAGNKGKVSLIERLTLARDLGALVASGDVQLGDALGRVPAILRDPSPAALRAALELVTTVKVPMVSAEDTPAFARFVAHTFGARARAMTWRTKPGEDDDLRLLRPTLLPFVADRGGDQVLGAEADKLAALWLDGGSTLEEDVVDAVLTVAAERGGRPLFDRLRAEAKKAKDDVRRRHLLNAMARFRDPAIVRESLEMLLGDEHDVRDMLGLLWQDPNMADVSFAFVNERFDALVAKLPGETLGWLPNIGYAFCDDKRAADVKTAFDARVPKLPGGPRNLGKTLDRIRLCSALRTAQAASLHRFLERKR